MAEINPNISYASIASGNFKIKDLSRFPLLPLKNYTFSSPFQQFFPFPYFIMNYLLKNPKSPDTLLKLYKSCKYFYLKQQILIVSGEFIPGDNGTSLTYKAELKKDISKLKKVHIWLNNDMMLRNSLSRFNFSQIYRSTIKYLCLHEMTLQMNEFKLLVAENCVEKTILYKSDVKDANAQNVSIDVILQLLPNLQNLLYINENEKFGLETLQKLKQIKFNQKFHKIAVQLRNVSETFDSKLFFQFILQNVSSEACKIYFNFSGENSDEIKSNVKAAANEMVPTEKGIKSLKVYYNMRNGFE
uniref:Uncharacterized protein n=1 Tax=Panagrolaimus superbus TaxID=310955 RepID=A0A914YKC4_9BILA